MGGRKPKESYAGRYLNVERRQMMMQLASRQANPEASKPTSGPAAASVGLNRGKRLYVCPVCGRRQMVGQLASKDPRSPRCRHCSPPGSRSRGPILKPASAQARRDRSRPRKSYLVAFTLRRLRYAVWEKIRAIGGHAYREEVTGEPRCEFLVQARTARESGLKAKRLLKKNDLMGEIQPLG